MDARKRTELGFRNFCGVWQLHYPVGKYLCKDGETCYLTNLAKAAVGTGFPGAGNEEKYEAWYPLLEKELGLVAKPDAKIISVGGKAGSFLSKKGLYGHVGTIPHYSGQAAGQPGPGDTRQGGGVREVQVETGSHTQLKPTSLTAPATRDTRPWKSRRLQQRSRCCSTTRCGSNASGNRNRQGGDSNSGNGNAG